MHEAILGVVRPDHRSPDYLEPGPTLIRYIRIYARKCGVALHTESSQIKSSQVKLFVHRLDLTSQTTR